MVLLSAVLGVTMGATIAWLVARRAAVVAHRHLELELTATRAQLQAREDALARAEAHARALAIQEEQLSGLLTTTRSEFARADAEARLMRARAEALADAERAAAEAQSRLDAALERAARAETLEGRLTDALSLVARREVELRVAAERREALEAQAALVEPLQDRVQTLSLSLSRVEAALEGERTRASERAAEAVQARATLRLEFEALAQRLLEEKGRALLEQNHRSLDGVLAPVRERLKAFEEQFLRVSDTEARDRAALLEKLRGLQDAQSRLHADAEALARALTGEARAQGDWGELVLESLLSTAGLTEGREYALQVDHRDEAGAHRRPDALIYLPPNRAIVVDSKCSLQAFFASTRATSPDEREVDLAAHVASLRAHVRALAQKDYQSVVKERTLDVVFLFVPNEAAFHAALSREPSLYEDAFRQRVMLCSPTTLLAALQVVSHVWRSERQALNASRIAEEAGKMIDKLALALEAFDELGTRLGGAQQAFEQARARLATGRGNVLQLATHVVELGARVSKGEKLESARRRLDMEDEEPPAAAGLQAELQLDATGEETSARRVGGERRGREQCESGDRRRVEPDADDEAVPRGEGAAPAGAALLPSG
ncbi:MAG: DNA recombination protein RmuC [Myxococcota bacterium]